MQIFFSGAAHEVTGSCHYVEACGKKFLVDCGMEQGLNLYENAPVPALSGELDFVLLTHAHIDHSGMLPLLYKHGFTGPVYTTKATKDLCDIMLLDSAHIQEFEAQWRTKKGKRKGQPDVEPIYTTEDASGILQNFIGVDYGQTIVPADGIKVMFTDVGHLLGSAAITVTICENDTQRTIVFSGDVGNIDQPLIRDPQPVYGCDTLVIESTYGDRIHEGRVPYIPRLVSILRDTFTRGGNVVIPSFAVGRTQEMLYFFRQIKEENLLPDFPDFEVYVDSPLAVNATTVFQKNIYTCFDDEALSLVRRGINPLQFPGLKLSVTSDDSKAINFDEKPKVIISASGMCDAGRIKHHLKYNLWREDSTILFVGYQSANTVGRAIVDGAASVKIFGEEIRVLAKIEQLAGISGHADQKGLLDWVGGMTQKPSRIYVVHGEDQVTDRFAALLSETFDAEAIAPYSGDAFDLLTGTQLAEGTREKTQKYQDKLKGKASSAVRGKAEAVYDALLAAGQRLLRVIGKNRYGANKDLRRFTDEINKLCDKYDR